MCAIIIVMDILLLALFLLICWRMKFAKIGQFHKDYSGLQVSTAIKGIFVILVFFCHFSSYVDTSVDGNAAWRVFFSWLGQLVVAMFLFYSGYGIMLSSRKKGDAYIKALPQKVLLLLAKFAFAVTLFLAFRILTGQETSLSQYLLSLIGWESIGNSNWYIFAIMALYLISFVGLRFARKKELLSAGIITALSLLFCFVMSRFKAGYWWNTALCYSVGVWWAVLQPKIDKMTMKNIWTWLISLAVSGLAFYFFWRRCASSNAFYLVCACLFCVVINLALMKVKIGNKVLDFFGKHVFSIYILQRLAFMTLGLAPWIQSNLYLYFVLSLGGTIVISLTFELITDYALGKITGKFGRIPQKAGKK